MGQRLTKWAGRIAGLYSLSPLAQTVLLRMSTYALDPDMELRNGDKGKPRSVCFISRRNLAQEIYNDPNKARNLDRPISELKALGLIEPTGAPPSRGHVQEFRLRIDEAVTISAQLLSARYPSEAQEIGRIMRRINRQT